MNAKTAEHLNKLLRSACPLQISDTGSLHEMRDGRPLVSDSHPRRLGILRALNDALLTIVPLAISAEIMDAAENKREANINAPLLWESVPSYYIGPRLLKMALPSARLAVEASNAEAARLYETYRLACSQGVAVPPMPTPETHEEI